MDKPIRPKSTAPDIPSEIADRPSFAELTPDEERAFLRALADFEAAFRQTGDPLPLWEALRTVERLGQTVPHWLSLALFPVVTRAMTDHQARRARERWQHARRYTCVRDLRRKRYTKDHALDRAVTELRAEGAAQSRETIEHSYDRVRTDLKRRGPESEY
jgi:hypothetical protein